MELNFVLYFSSHASFGCEELKGKNKMNGKLPSFELFGCSASPLKRCTFANMAVDCGCMQYLCFICCCVGQVEEVLTSPMFDPWDLREVGQ